ncbi:MAG: WYL domain-containing protein [Anaerolineae bacterium]
MRDRVDFVTAGRGALTRRQVTPYRLEQRARTLYLIAYCHHVHAKRTFRLDRMRDLAVIDKPEPPQDNLDEPWYDWLD